jgi:cell division septum initiation protein DivIVA
VVNQGKRVVDPNEAREFSDMVIRKLVEVAREGVVVDVDTLRERTLAAFARAQAH